MPIRVIAVALPLRDGRVLLERGDDPTNGHTFLRAIGGGVEFQELAADAVVREWREEIGVTLQNVALITVLENTPFTYKGKPRHEVVFVHSAELPAGFATARELTVTEHAGATVPKDVQHRLVWADVAELRRAETPVYPKGVLDTLP